MSEHRWNWTTRANLASRKGAHVSLIEEVLGNGLAPANASADPLEAAAWTAAARVLLNLMGQAVPADLSLELLVVNRRPVASFALEPSHRKSDARFVAARAGHP